jgi:hypothetical protein
MAANEKVDLAEKTNSKKGNRWQWEQNRRRRLTPDRLHRGMYKTEAGSESFSGKTESDGETWEVHQSKLVTTENWGRVVNSRPQTETPKKL